MDFSDFSEFIGPLIFGIIAWLSSYFSKKKKPNQSSPDTLKNKADVKSKFEQLIQDSFNPVGVEEKPLEEVEIAENIENKESEDIKINNNDIDLSEQIVEPETKKENVTVIKESSLSKLKGRLKNKDSLKEVVILKEILDRKY
tara:strand:+ start:1582 stop:2010 length:429 start_codon:yes stop_codon:yes gene_type:complete